MSGRQPKRARTVWLCTACQGFSMEPGVCTGEHGVSHSASDRRPYLDARDVEELKRALEEVSKARPVTGVPLKDTLAGCRQIAKSALAPFDSSTQEGE